MPPRRASQTATRLTPELLISAYCQGAFPMASGRRGKKIQWYSPDPRAIFELHPPEAFHVSRSLARTVRQRPFHITFDTAFERVVLACAEPRATEKSTWINDEIVRAYTHMHAIGLAHSIEAWEDSPDTGTRELVGGVYGLSLGGAFFGESMFSRRTNASKICLVHLANQLRCCGFVLFDVQLSNPHLEQFNVVELPREKYMERLHEALHVEVHWIVERAGNA
jgi:leucyl/phenylalanyl-tRNA---protein transferase